MSELYRIVTNVFYQLSLVFFWPVAIGLLGLFAVCLTDLGALFYQMWRRQREKATNLPAVAKSIARGLRGFRRGEPLVCEAVDMSPALERFWGRLRTRLEQLGSDEHLDIWLEETLQHEEIHATSKLDRSRAFIRIGPMLGLAGTIIPLGPALQSLLTGDMAGMVSHLVVGFGAVVVGLMLSGLAYFITLVRERWTRVELKEMENLCELVLRAMKERSPAPEEAYETLSEA